MNYADLRPIDISNGPGVRVSLFVSGCRLHCPGCFNKEAWNFNYGKKFTYEAFQELMTALDNANVQGLSILGGDPLEPENIPVVTDICKTVRAWRPDRDIWLWSGRQWEDVKDLPLFWDVDVLVDGPFVEAEKDLRLAWRGSANQRVIDILASRRAGTCVTLGEKHK